MERLELLRSVVDAHRSPVLTGLLLEVWRELEHTVAVVDRFEDPPRSAQVELVAAMDRARERIGEYLARQPSIQTAVTRLLTEYSTLVPDSDREYLEALVEAGDADDLRDALESLVRHSNDHGLKLAAARLAAEI